MHAPRIGDLLFACPARARRPCLETGVPSAAARVAGVTTRAARIAGRYTLRVTGHASPSAVCSPCASTHLRAGVQSSLRERVTSLSSLHAFFTIPASPLLRTGHGAHDVRITCNGQDVSSRHTTGPSTQCAPPRVRQARPRTRRSHGGKMQREKAALCGVWDAPGSVMERQDTRKYFPHAVPRSTLPPV